MSNYSFDNFSEFLSQKKKGEMMKKNEETKTGKFDFPFDVEKFAKAFPADWSLVDEYSNQDGNLLIGSDSNFIVAAPHKISPRKPLIEYVNEFADDVEDHSEILEFKTTTGTKLWVFEYRHEDGDSLKTAFMAEVMGPALMSARFIYNDEVLNQEIKNTLIQAVQNLEWFEQLPSIQEENLELSLKDIKHLVRKKLKGHTEQKESLLATFEDEDYISLYPLEVEELIELGPEYYSFAISIIWFAHKHSEISPEDCCEFAKMCETGCLNCPHLQRKLIEQAVSNASESDDFLALAGLSKLKIPGMLASQEYFQKAVIAVQSVCDAQAVLGNKLADENTFAQMYELLEKNLEDKEFVDAIYNPADMLEVAKDSELIGIDRQRQGLEMLLQSNSQALPYMSMVSSVYDDSLADLRNAFLKKAMDQATTAEKKIEIYEFIKDELEDEKRASEYLEENKDELSQLLGEKEQSEEQEQLIDNICQCALLAAAGDGSISEEESEEVGQMRATVEMIFRNRHAIELLEETEDIEKAREARSGTFLIHSLTLFAPAYHREVIEHLQEVQGPEGFISLVKLYAAKIEDPFARKIAAWASQEVAAIDGLDDGEQKVLSVMADVWGIKLKENSRFIEDVVGPIISDEIAFTGKSSSDKELLDDAKKMDEMLKADENSELAESLGELLGANSIEDLAKKIFEIEENEEYEETEEFPDIFGILNESQGAWEQVAKAAKNGVAVNEIVNMQGLAGLSILILAAEQAPLSVVRALVEAGADINHKLLNVEKPTGYNSALVVSIKGAGRIDIFDYFLECGADPDPFEDKESGWTPLTIATMNHNYEAVKTLLAKGVDPNIATSDGGTAFKMAAGQTEFPEALKCARALLKAGADPLRLDNEGFACIHNAVCKGTVDWIKFLIEKAEIPVDYPVKSLKGLSAHTPLLRAMNWGNLPVVEYLLSKGADVNARNGNRSIFSSIVMAAKDSELDEPLEQVERFISLGTKPKFSDVMEVLEQLENMDDEEDTWCIDVADRLMKTGKFKKGSLKEYDHDELEEWVDNGMENAPELTEHLLALFKKYGFDIQAYIEG